MRPVIQWFLDLHHHVEVRGDGDGLKGRKRAVYTMFRIGARLTVVKPCPRSQKPYHPQSEKSEYFFRSQDKHRQAQGLFITLV
jgi:hypothetical protein